MVCKIQAAQTVRHNFDGLRPHWKFMTGPARWCGIQQRTQIPGTSAKFYHHHSSPWAVLETRMLHILRLIAPSTSERHRRKSLHSNPPVRCTVSDLPPEILEEIFLHCLPPGLPRMERGGLVGTVALVKAPSLEAHPEDGHLQLLKLYLEKSARKAISITFDLPRGPSDAPLLPLIIPYLSQSQHLTITSSHRVPDQEPCITHDHFPLLKNLELPYLSLGNATLEGQLTIVGLEGMRFPWAQLTRLTIQFRNTIEALVLLRNCSCLEVFHLRSAWGGRAETSRTPPEPKIVHHQLRTITFKDMSDTDLFIGFTELLGCLTTPALSALTLTRREDTHHTGDHAMQPILSFIRTPLQNSPP
ncbi:hypothetical protein BD779DRAFT_1734519 [Infundibulicybe gibba]|nr:hypothetical protein BD779DRAFT_1734519 [Infundibulicybe gibba]